LKRIFFITGQPGIGKTSVILKTVEELKKQGFRVGGIVSREVREHGIRVGFEILDISSQKRGLLAHVNQQNGPQLSKYRINLNDIKKIGATAILKAIANAQIIIIDEIGPMELFSKEFKNAVYRAIESNKIIIGTIHYRAKDPLIQQIRNAEDAEIIEVTIKNRDTLHKILLQKILAKYQSNLKLL